LNIAKAMMAHRKFKLKMTKNDEALQVEKITLQAKLGILSLNFLCAIIAFAIIQSNT
jgi:hypothetical protein